jgi:hypothetical protein
MNRYLITFECETVRATMDVESERPLQTVDAIFDALVIVGKQNEVFITKSKIIILFFCKLN